MSTETSKRKRLFGASRSRGLESVTAEQWHGWRQEWLRDRVSSCRQEVENTQGIMTLCRILKLIPSDILSLTKPRLLTSPQKSPSLLRNQAFKFLSILGASYSKKPQLHFIRFYLYFCALSMIVQTLVGHFQFLMGFSLSAWCGHVYGVCVCSLPMSSD